MRGGKAGRKLSDGRIADLARLVGPLPAEVVSAYSARSPTAVQLAGVRLHLVHPAVQEGNAKATTADSDCVAAGS